MLRKRLLTVSAVVIGMTLAGVVLVRATIPAPNGVIYGCYNTSGLLKVIDNATTTCNPGETSLNWNQTGPQGPIGPSHAYITGSSRFVDVDPTGENVLTINVPKGSFIIDGKTTLELHTTPGQALATCQLVYSPPTGTLGDITSVLLFRGILLSDMSIAAVNPSVISLHDAQTFSVPTAINLFCIAGATAEADFPVVRATLVGGIN
jgi:hypothetical protein